MIDKLVDEINVALSHNLYFAALSLVLTLPDICGRAEYPSAGVAKRYITWYNEYIAETILFLASEQARMITGQVIKVSGGKAL